MTLDTGAQVQESDSPVVRRPKALEAGLFLVVVAVPLAFTPLTTAPFPDIKLVILVGGALLVWASGAPVDRRLAVFGSVWAGVCLLSALVGVDRWVSVFGGQNSDAGVLLLGTSAYLLAVGARLPRDLVERIALWLAVTGVVAAVVSLVAFFFPGASSTWVHNVALDGSTLGNPVFVDGFLSASLVAALAVRRLHGWKLALVLLAISSGLGASSQRSALVLPLVALAVWAWRSRPGWRRASIVVCSVTVLLGVWGVFGKPAASAGGATSVAQFETTMGEKERLAVLEVYLHGIAKRPLLGWGPDAGLSAFRASATPSLLLKAGSHDWSDAHDIFVETAATSGNLGLVALLVLAGAAATRLRSSPDALGWAAAAAAALFVHALVEPRNVVNTPLLFLFAGVACSGSAEVPARSYADSERVRAVAKAVLGLLLVVGLVGSLDMFVASALEQWGAAHYDEWALRASLAIQPWRTSAGERLAMNYALDACDGSTSNASLAFSQAEDTVSRHPWDPTVRITQMNVDHLLNNSAGFAEALREQLSRFPADASWISQQGSPSATRGGCLPG